MIAFQAAERSHVRQLFLRVVGIRFVVRNTSVFWRQLVADASENGAMVVGRRKERSLGGSTDR